MATVKESTLILDGEYEAAAYLQLKKIHPFTEAQITNTEPFTLTFPQPDQASAALGLIQSRTKIGEKEVLHRPLD